MLPDVRCQGAARQAARRRPLRAHQARADAEAAGGDPRARPSRSRASSRNIAASIPMGATASHVVGLVDVDNKGLAGIEKFIDDNPQLTMSADEAVTISLDLGAQHVLREELGKAIKTYRAKAAAGIVMDVHSRRGAGAGLASRLRSQSPRAGARQGPAEPHRLRRLRDGLGVQGVHRRRRARHRPRLDALAVTTPRVRSTTPLSPSTISTGSIVP